jgi:5'-3' exonuclease
MPALDIADNAFDLLFYTYKQCRKEWLEECQESGDGDLPYLTHEGNIVSGSRLEHFLSEVGGHELSYYDKKKQSAPKDNQRMRKESKRFGTDSTIPDDDVLKSKEDSDRAAYRQMLQRQLEEKEAAAANNGQTRKFTPVLSERVELQPIPGVEFQPIQEDLEEGLISRMSSLLQNSLSNEDDDDDDDDASRYALRAMDDQDLKGRYYYDKFQFTPFDAEKHQALRKAYMEGLVWNLKYYYQGCVSWEWYYPYHYGTFVME